jgi:membrane-associated phospholipid phosphatase
MTKMMRSRENTRSATVALLILALLAVPLAAQETHGKKPGLKQAAHDFTEDAGRIWSSPFRIKERHVGPLIALAATTAFLIATDEDIRGAFQGYGDRHPWVDDVGPVITQLGGLGAVATAGLFLGAGLVFKDDRARDTGYLAACAMAQSFIVEHALKGLSGRQRPFIADGTDRWSGPAGFFKRCDSANQGLYDSFPSGHSTWAFSLATVVALQYRHTAWVPVLAYTIAAGVGLTRVTMDRHWMSDVVFGAVIGHLVARLVVRSHFRRQRLVPVLGCSGGGITLGFHYNLDPVY